jgi:hypothetical protein
VFLGGWVRSLLLVLRGSGGVKSYEWRGTDEMRDAILRLVDVAMVAYVERVTRSGGWFGKGGVGCEGEMWESRGWYVGDVDTSSLLATIRSVLCLVYERSFRLI